ncbi:MAG TPA: ABC transporter substrate-binding protein, partial [Rubrobacter sp.]|nr:ABC transporter substrate-binding protein [Rubrobacter sp.]
LIDRDRMLTVNPNAAANALSLDQKSDYIYRVSYSNYQLGTPGAAYFAENVGKTAVALAPDYPAGQETLPAFVAAYEEAGGEVVEEIFPPLGNADYATYLTQIQDAEPELVWAFFAGADAVNFATQYREFGLGEEIQFVGMNTWSDPLITEAVGEAAEGIIAATQWIPALDNETNKRFVEGYQKEYDETPNQFSVFGYDAAQLIAQGVEKAGSAESEALSKAMKGISFESPRGEITIDPKTNNPTQSYVVTRNVNQGGEIVPEVLEEIGEFNMPTENVPGTS